MTYEYDHDDDEYVPEDDCDVYDPQDEADDEWHEGECDHCSGGDENGVTADGPLGPIYCACFIGQGADEDDCHCGPIDDDQVGQPCPRCS